MHGVTTPSLFQLKMAAIVCHGQSSLDSHHHLIHTHRLRKPPLTPSHHLSYLEQTPNHHKTTPQNNTSLISYSKSCEGGWGFVPSSLSREEKETAPYVHPQVKLSSLRMSPKSLELCTENLGNESGTDIMGDSGIHVFTSSEQSTCTSSTQCFGGNKKKMKKKKIAKTKSFPPPLTTMRGSESIQVRPHREGGRLVIEITKAPSTSSSCFRAQRSHGRLRLSLLDHHEEEEEEEEEEFEGEVEDEEETEEMEEEEEEEGDKRCGVRIEREKKRRSSCKEEGDHENIIRNWEWGESIWVATS